MYTLVHFHDAKKSKKAPLKKVKLAKRALKKEQPVPVVKKSNRVDVPKSALFERNKALENHYRSQLLGVANKVDSIVKSKNNPEAMISSLDSYSQMISDWARWASRGIVYNMNHDDRATWFQNSLNLSRGLKKEITTAPIDDLLAKYIDEQYQLITSLPSTAARRIENIVKGNLYKGTMRSKTLAELIYNTGAVTKSRAQLIARTEISKMSTGLTKVRSEVLGLDWYIWKATHDIRVRDSHKFMHNVVCNWNDPPDPERLSGKAKPYGNYHAGETFNCFPESTYVDFSNGCDKLWKRFYNGAIINLMLSNGTFLQATPNHPVLTRNGWSSVDTLKEGDNLFHTFIDGSNIFERYKDNSIPTFGNLFESVSKFCEVIPTSRTKFNLHGEIPENDVDVVNIDRFLGDYFMSSSFKSLFEFYFPNPDVDSRIIQLGSDRFLTKSVSGIRPPHFLISVAYDFFAFLNRHARHPDVVGFTPVPSRDIMMSKNFANSSSTTLVAGGKGQLTFSPNVPRDYIILWELALSWIMKITLQFNVPQSKMFSEGFPFATNSLCNFGNGFTGLYLTSNVVKKFITPFVGHVYNLQSFSGWYTVTSSNVIVKNCRCYPDPLLRMSDVSFPVKVHQRGRIKTMNGEQFRRLIGGDPLTTEKAT